MWWVDAYGAVHLFPPLFPFLSEVYSNHVVLLRALLCCPGEHIVSVAASWISLWTLPLCFLSLILLHSAVTNWEYTLSIPRGPPGLNSTCPLNSNYPQLIISLGYCGNSSENILYATQATVKRFFCPPLSHNCQSIKKKKYSDYGKTSIYCL